MRSSLLFIWIVVVFAACRKKDCFRGTDDAFSHTVYAPSLEVTHVQHIALHPSGCGSVPFPSDSTGILPIDLDGDGRDDIQIVMRGVFNLVSNSNPCVNYGSRYSIEALEDDWKIAALAEYDALATFDEGQNISIHGLWNARANIQIVDPLPGPHISFTGETYVGVRNKSDGHCARYGWLRLEQLDYTIIVHEIGFQSSGQGEVKAGQY